tara:strand:+ start:338 stop:487 length:150 start_codon:yes stop_codon:yes gene_type:complete
MNAFEFLFAFFTVFGVSGFWYVWTSFVYRLENAKEEIKEDITNEQSRTT